MSEALKEATALMAAKEVELEAKGYHPPLVTAAIKRARGNAQFKVAHVSHDICEQAFLDTLRHELSQAEVWLLQEQDGMTLAAGTCLADKERR